MMAEPKDRFRPGRRTKVIDFRGRKLHLCETRDLWEDVSREVWRAVAAGNRRRWWGLAFFGVLLGIEPLRSVFFNVIGRPAFGTTTTGGKPAEVKPAGGTHRSAELPQALHGHMNRSHRQVPCYDHKNARHGPRSHEGKPAGSVVRVHPERSCQDGQRHPSNAGAEKGMSMLHC